jgi:serine/threonine protein kinase
VDGRVGLPKGTLLDGSYRIERVIGSGGFGITYEAEDVKLGTNVAIKEYYPEEFGYRDASLRVRPKSEQHTKTFEWGRSRFLQEASTLARFRHPSVVQVTRVFEVFSTAYMVMVFEQGQSFEGWLKHLGRPPTQEELDRIAGPILDALEMMHGESFLHRDIAPDNIIVRADGTPVLLDFGAARRAVAEESRSLTGVVKSGYSPQEQYATDGRLQGPWTDIYAFGATLYRAVTGKVPEESTLRTIDDRMLSAVSVGDWKYRPGFLEAIDACLEVHHADRPQSVAQVRSILLTRPAGEIPLPAQVVTAPLVETRKTGTTKPPLVPPTQRSLKAWWAIYFASVIAVVGGVFGGLQYTRWQGAKLVADVEDGYARRVRKVMKVPVPFEIPNGVVTTTPPVPVPVPARSPPSHSQTSQNDVIAQASRRLEAGDVVGARELLAAAEDGSQGPVLFALAETYDPNMLTAWGTRGVAADVARARALYRKALSLGVASAHARLEALK